MSSDLNPDPAIQCSHPAVTLALNTWQSTCRESLHSLLGEPGVISIAVKFVLDVLGEASSEHKGWMDDVLQWTRVCGEGERRP